MYTSSPDTIIVPMKFIVFNKRIIFILILAIFFQSPYLFGNTNLQRGMAIRDAEIEKILKSYIHPIFRQAKLNPKDLNLIILIEPDANAAATLNNTMIINTGFILRTESLAEVVGVLAHEVGHMEGQHVVRSIGAMEETRRATLISAAIGMGLGMLAQRPDLAAALAFGSSISGIYAYLKYNRAEEGSADQAAVRYLNGLCWPADGLISFFKKLLGQELLGESLQDPYVRSHPLTRDRIMAIESQIQNSCQKPFPQKMLEGYTIMKTKLIAFLDTPQNVIKRYTQQTPLDLYAQAIAHYRMGHTNKAIHLLESIKSSYAHPAYVIELMGQIYYEAGQIDQSIKAYREALTYDSSDPIFKMNLALSLISKNSQSDLKEAKALLESVQKIEPQNLSVWHFLSIVYGRQNQMDLMALSLAEKAVLMKDWKEAHEQVRRALHFAKKGSTAYLRAQDLQIETKRETNKSTQTQRF